MSIQGLRHTDNFVADERPKNWREGLLRLYPNGKMPLTGLTSQMKSRTVDDPQFYWWEKEMQDQRFALGANIAASAASTTITLAAGQKATKLKEGDLLYVEQTGEILLVTVDPAADTSFTVQRAYAGTTAQSVDYDGTNINPNLIKIGSAYEEGSEAPTGIGYDPTKVYNYTQIFRDTLEATRTGMRTRLRTGDQVREAKRECLELHGVGIERALFLSARNETTRNGKPIRTTGGILWYMNQNASSRVVDVNAAYGSGLTMAGLEEYMYEIFKYGSNEKMILCGNRFTLTIQQVLRKNASWEFMSGIKEYGMNVSRLISPFGELVMKTHPLFNQQMGGTNAGSSTYYGMESWGFVLDMENVMYVNFTDADTKYQADLQDNGVDGMKSGYLTECALELHHPKTHFVMKNVIAAAADAT